MLLSSFTVKLAGSVTSTRPHLSTASLIDPLNISILAFLKSTVVPGFSKSTWSLRAVKTMTPVSSPTMHSAMRTWREAAGPPPAARARGAMGLALTTLTVRVCPTVPGPSWSTLTNTGFLSAGFSPPFAAATVAMAAGWIRSGVETLMAAEKLLVSNGSESGPVNSTPSQQRHLALSTLRTSHDVMDISKGEEKIRISIVNDFGKEKCPPSFCYIPRNLVFQNALVSMSLAKIGGEDCCADCFGDCLSSPEPCACARQTGGEYAYTVEGLVRPAFIDECVSMNRFPEEHQKVFCETCPLERSRNKASPKPCRSHLVRKFIKECWSKCGCNMQCGNRVVQRGITCNLQVFFTGKGTGWGLRTLDKLPKGAFVCEYAGEILTNTELHERVVENMQNDRYVHPILLDAGWCSRKVLKEEEALCLDGTFYGNVGRFINHRCCDANLVVVPVEVETPDHHYYHLAFFTSTKVEAFEELTWDYGIDFDAEKQKPVKPFECLCGSRYCRGRKHHPRKKSATAAGAD